MSLRFTSLSLLSLAALAGCPGGDSDHDARFAGASDQQLERAFSAGSGGDLTTAIFIGIVFSGVDMPDACPSIVTDGNTTTVTGGGCTDEEGATWNGTIVSRNFPGFLEDNPAYDETQPSSVTFDAEIVDGDETVRLDGDVTVDPDDHTIASDLTIEAEGLTSTSRLTLGCDDDGPCTASPDSEIEISGLGGAAVSGTWNLDDPPSGSVTLTGADTIVFDLGARDSDGCVPYQVGGESGTVCAPDEGEGDAPFAARALRR